MFSVPNAREIDPNRFVAFFYCLLFGMMLGDAGYGIVITLGCWLVLKLLKPVGGKKLVQVIMMGGVSTIFWGIMFGGWFGIQGLENTILRPYLLSPMNNPLEMLGLSIGIGLFQILFGMGISMAQKFKNGRAIDALLDILPWHIFFLGIILMVVSMLLGFDLGGIPTYLMIAALAVIVLFGGRSKKGIAGKILGGLSGLYKVVGFLSDLLSYSRLFGLALAGGVIAMVFNLLGGLLMGSIISIPFAIVIFLVGHIFNIAINLLGTYVHDSRLQYIEFFSRFYEGEGYLFAPLGSVTRYTTIIPEKSIMDFSKKTAQATTELLTNDN
jgi:V/A-type H+-transporting ATPase subunit I